MHVSLFGGIYFVKTHVENLKIIISENENGQIYVRDTIF